jgi:hypothetical protein
MGGKGSGRPRSANKPPSHTNYYRAWTSFFITKEYYRIRDYLESKGMKQPYIDNLIQSVFEAGWNGSGVEIVIESPPQNNKT